MTVWAPTFVASTRLTLARRRRRSMMVRPSTNGACAAGKCPTSMASMPRPSVSPTWLSRRSMTSIDFPGRIPTCTTSTPCRKCVPRLASWPLPRAVSGCKTSSIESPMGRGVEQTLLDIALEDPVYLRLVEIRHEFYMRYVARILEAASGRIDLVLCGDDFGTQRGLLISPTSFDRLFAPLKREFFDMVHSYGAKITHHCCGSSRQLIPRFIDCGMDSLQTIQPQAEGMNPYELKAEFAGRIVLHGAVDVQGWLQRATPSEVRQEVHRLMDEVGRGGGFILAPCHNIQPDTPLENVLALYDAVAERRGKSIR